MDLYKSAPKTFSALFEPFSKEVKHLGEVVRKQIMTSLPDAAENVYGGKKVGNALYSLNGSNNVICGVQPQGSMVRVFFHNWKLLEEAGYRLEGSGKNARHIKIENESDLERFDIPLMLQIVLK